MPAVATIPANKPILNLKTAPAKVAAGPEKLGPLIAKLHGVLTNPATPPLAAAAAKWKLLGILERTRGMRLPDMTAPLMASSPGRIDHATRSADSARHGARTRRTRAGRTRNTVSSSRSLNIGTSAVNTPRSGRMAMRESHYS